jgi:hypothetical protein
MAWILLRLQEISPQPLAASSQLLAFAFGFCFWLLALGSWLLALGFWLSAES